MDGRVNGNVHELKLTDFKIKFEKNGVFREGEMNQVRNLDGRKIASSEPLL